MIAVEKASRLLQSFYKSRRNDAVVHLHLVRQMTKWKFNLVRLYRMHANMKAQVYDVILHKSSFVNELDRENRA